MSDGGTVRTLTEERPGRLEALSDGVFAIALTLLIIDVVAVAKGAGEEVSLADHLVEHTPTFLAYLRGFATILVCWINHHAVFRFIRRGDAGLPWVNGLQLALVSAVPLPTALIAEHKIGDGQTVAALLYGATFFGIAVSFALLCAYAERRGLTDAALDPSVWRGLRRNYGIAVVWTFLALLLGAVVSTWVSAVMWPVMFLVFAFPIAFARATAGRRGGA
jgi:uncharacterized membrane protein